MPHLSQEMIACIDECLNCYRTCLTMATGHCRDIGGGHTEKAHFTLMLACSEMCRTSAHLMLTGTDVHRLTCAACADICERCAGDCERVGDMQDCVDACRRCAESCRKMAA